MSEPSHKSQSQMRTLVTDEFRSHHEAVFGERKPARGRWVWDKARGEMVPASEYVPPAPEDRALMVVTDRYMEGVRAEDGTDISSRQKRAEYMRRNGLADAADYRQHHAERPKREAQAEARELARVTESVGRTAYELTQKRRRR